MLYVRVDEHKAHSQMTAMDETGTVLERHRVASSREGMLRACGRHEGESRRRSWRPATAGDLFTIGSMRIKARRGTKDARTATVRKLAELAWTVCTENRPLKSDERRRRHERIRTDNLFRPRGGCGERKRTKTE